MSNITTISNSSEALIAAQTAEESSTDLALAAAINQASACGQTCLIFSTKLSDAQIQRLKDEGYAVTINPESVSVNPQYIISMKAESEGE